MHRIYRQRSKMIRKFSLKSTKLLLHSDLKLDTCKLWHHTNEAFKEIGIFFHQTKRPTIYKKLVTFAEVAMKYKHFTNTLCH